MRNLAFLIAVVGCHSANGTSSDGGLGLVTQCARDAATCTGGSEPLCCPGPGPIAPMVLCSTVCDSDHDCVATPSRPHCSKPSPLGGMDQAGLCMPAAQECCWYCR